MRIPSTHHLYAPAHPQSQHRQAGDDRLLVRADLLLSIEDAVADWLERLRQLTVRTMAPPAIVQGAYPAHQPAARRDSHQRPAPGRTSMETPRPTHCWQSHAATGLPVGALLQPAWER